MAAATCYKALLGVLVSVQQFGCAPFLEATDFPMSKPCPARRESLVSSRTPAGQHHGHPLGCVRLAWVQGHTHLPLLRSSGVMVPTYHRP